MMNIALIDYGAGNVFSVQTALKRLGIDVRLTADPAVVQGADRVIFPGVGQASEAMRRLRDTGLDRILPGLRQPVLGICLGMQLMCRTTEEGDTEGLGIFPLDVHRFDGGFKIPHMGWNSLTALRSGLFRGIPEGEMMYFVHSYYVPESVYTIAACDYHGTFAAAIRKDNFYGCQFHPEKSSAAGELLLKNFLSGELSEL